MIAAAYSGVTPAAQIRPLVTRVLARLAGEHVLTQPMADLLTCLDPDALDSAFGPDLAAGIDRELGLAAGTSGLVIGALAEKVASEPGSRLRKIADRAAVAFPLASLPDFSGWSGPPVLTGRIASGSIVRAGLASPGDMTPDDYMASVQRLWAPGG